MHVFFGTQQPWLKHTAPPEQAQFIVPPQPSLWPFNSHDVVVEHDEAAHAQTPSAAFVSPRQNEFGNCVQAQLKKPPPERG